MLSLSAGAQGLRVEFDRQCSTERRHDPLTLLDSNARIVSVRSGRGRVCLEPDLQNILRFVTGLCFQCFDAQSTKAKVTLWSVDLIEGLNCWNML